MRISFFSQQDSCSLTKTGDPESIRKGLCLTSRIGDAYNNPAFGYGGYCLGGDTNPLLGKYEKAPQTLIPVMVFSNAIRKGVIADSIIKRNARMAVVDRLVIKNGSDNFRESVIHGIIKRVKGEII